jgi:hypothetical protein
MREHVRISVHNFYAMEKASLELIEYPEQLKKSVELDVTYIDNSKIPNNLLNIPRNFTYYVNSTYLGPFEHPDSDLKSFLNTVTEFRINYSLKTMVPFYYENNYECFHWVNFY